MQQPRENILMNNIHIEILLYRPQTCLKTFNLVNKVLNKWTIEEASFRSISPITYKEENSSEYFS